LYNESLKKLHRGKQMANDQDTAYILALHMAHQAAQQNGFHHTERVLHDILARQIGHTGATGAKETMNLATDEQMTAVVEA
jgi:hypothetical protein